MVDGQNIVVVLVPVLNKLKAVGRISIHFRFHFPLIPLRQPNPLTLPTGDSDATLQNVIIGKNQAEGVHCSGPCTLKYVWFEDVCEDAISVKDDKAGEETWIIGGGAYHASDKVVQHNGCGTVNIINFYVEDYGKLYRS